MARKRAKVDAVLSVTGASALFAQDVANEPAVPDPGPSSRREPEAPSGGGPTTAEAEEGLRAMLAELDHPLAARRAYANAGMELLGSGATQRLRELSAATTEEKLEGLIAAVHATADRGSAGA